MIQSRNKKIKPNYTGVKEIAERLKIARLSAGYETRKQFALKNKIPTSTYQKHESGEKNILPISIINYCKILNISLVWLMTGSESHKDKGFESINKDEAERGAEEYYIAQCYIKLYYIVF